LAREHAMSSKEVEVEVGEDLRARPELSERAVLDVLPRAIAVASVDGRIVRWNRQAEALYGWTEAEVLGRDHVIPVGQPRDEVAEHERAGRKAVQQHDGRRPGRARLPVEHSPAVHSGVAMVDGSHTCSIQSPPQSTCRSLPVLGVDR